MPHIQSQQQFLTSVLRVHGLPAVLSQEQQLETADPQKTRKHLRSILFLPRLLKLVNSHIPLYLVDSSSLIVYRCLCFKDVMQLRMYILRTIISVDNRISRSVT